MFGYDVCYALAQPPRTAAVNTDMRRKQNQRNTGVKMAVNDFCRLCEVNLHILGTISASKLIYDSRDKQENICSQLSKLGLT